MIDSRFTEKIEMEINSEDRRKIFRQGCCYHFALRIHLDRLPTSRVKRIVDRINGSTHACLLTTRDEYVDIDGVYSETDFISSIQKRFGMIEYEIEELEIPWLFDKISEREMPVELTREVYRLALSEFDTRHEFASLKLVSPLPVTAKDQL